MISRISYDAAAVGTEENNTEKERSEEDVAEDSEDVEETEVEGSGDETEDEEASERARDDEETETDAPSEEEVELSPWQVKAQRARDLWDAGNNADLKKVLDQLEQAPSDETEAHEVARVMRQRLKPDPVAIGLWLLTLGIFCLLTYLYVLK